MRDFRPELVLTEPVFGVATALSKVPRDLGNHRLLVATAKVAENMKSASLTRQNVLPIKGDLLVEHFAQLAADTAGVTMAVVTLFGGRRDSAATIVAIGLTSASAVARSFAGAAAIAPCSQ